MWVLSQYNSGNLAFKDLLQGPSGKTSGWGAGAGGLVSKRVLRIYWRSACKYLTVESTAAGARAGAASGAGVRARDTAGAGV